MSETGIARVDSAMGVLADQAQTLENRVAAYSVLHQVQLRINRGLRASRDALIEGMKGDGFAELGPVSIKRTATEVSWPCNDEANWTDANVQDAMAVLVKIAPEYIRHVPDHFEIDSAALGKGLADSDPVAKQLHLEIKARGWRQQGGWRSSLAVREVHAPVKEKVA